MRPCGSQQRHRASDRASHIHFADYLRAKQAEPLLPGIRDGTSRRDLPASRDHVPCLSSVRGHPSFERALPVSVPPITGAKPKRNPASNRPGVAARPQPQHRGARGSNGAARRGGGAGADHRRRHRPNPADAIRHRRSRAPGQSEEHPRPERTHNRGSLSAAPRPAMLPTRSASGCRRKTRGNAPPAPGSP